MGTPFQNAGYTKDTKFKLLHDDGGFLEGEIVILDGDDGTELPYFKSMDGSNRGCLYLPNDPDGLPDLEVYDEVMKLVNHINYDITLLGKEVVYNRTGQRYLIEGVDISLETITVGSDKDTGAITCKLEDVSFVDEEGWILNNGTEPQYLLEGGKIDVKFRDGNMQLEVTNDNREGDGYSKYAAYNWGVFTLDNSIVAWRPSVASPVDDTAISESEVYTDHQEEENASTTSVGASVHIFVKLSFNNTDYAISRDEAYKIYQDLKHIFEEKIV